MSVAAASSSSSQVAPFVLLPALQSTLVAKLTSATFLESPPDESSVVRRDFKAIPMGGIKQRVFFDTRRARRDGKIHEARFGREIRQQLTPALSEICGRWKTNICPPISGAHPQVATDFGNGVEQIRRLFYSNKLIEAARKFDRDFRLLQDERAFLMNEIGHLYLRLLLPIIKAELEPRMQRIVRCWKENIAKPVSVKHPEAARQFCLGLDRAVTNCFRKKILQLANEFAPNFQWHKQELERLVDEITALYRKHIRPTKEEQNNESHHTVQ